MSCVGVTRHLCVWVALSVLLGCAATSSSQVGHTPALSSSSARSDLSQDPYRAIVEEWARVIPPDTVVRVGVGNFPYADSDVPVPLSARIVDEIETALSRDPRFRLIARSHLRDLEQERRFHGHSLFDPDTTIPDIKVDAIDVIVRGKVYPGPKGVELFAEQVLLEGGRVLKSKVAIPGMEHRSIAPVYQQAIRDVQQIRQDLLLSIPRQFSISVIPSVPRQTYRRGETISFVVRADRDCHVAVLAHQPDGTSVLLFPNKHDPDDRIPGGRDVSIPGTRNPGFEIVIGPPYGVDVVQVIACTEQSDFHAELSRLNLQMRAPYATLDPGMRGMYPRPVDGAGPLWSSDYTLVATEP